jgi:MinD superfamily P-loop ATPase
VGIPVPEVDESKCTYCGKCAQICEFNALVVVKEKVLFFPELCHGCGGCSYICPEKAIKEVKREIGVIEKGTANGMDFSHGVLNVGEPMAPPLIKQVKNLITDTGKITIVDASPGTSCPVVETVKDTDFCLLVTEPTPFGLNDLKLAVEMLRKLAIPFGVVINCADIGNKEVAWYCEREGIPIVLTIPWDRRIAEAYSTGIPLQKALPDFKDIFSQLYQTLERLVKT